MIDKLYLLGDDLLLAHGGDLRFLLSPLPLGLGQVEPVDADGIPPLPDGRDGSLLEGPPLAHLVVLIVQVLSLYAFIGVPNDTRQLVVNFITAKCPSNSALAISSRHCINSALVIGHLLQGAGGGPHCFMLQARSRWLRQYRQGHPARHIRSIW